MFDWFDKLENIDLSDNKLKTIETWTFWNTIEVLSLQWNNLDINADILLNKSTEEKTRLDPNDSYLDIKVVNSVIDIVKNQKKV